MCHVCQAVQPGPCHPWAVPPPPPAPHPPAPPVAPLRRLLGRRMAPRAARSELLGVWRTPREPEDVHCFFYGSSMIFNAFYVISSISMATGDAAYICL